MRIFFALFANFQIEAFYIVESLNSNLLIL